LKEIQEFAANAVEENCRSYEEEREFKNAMSKEREDKANRLRKLKENQVANLNPDPNLHPN